MSNELERRLERALGEAPGPDPGAPDRALRAALEALPAPGEAAHRVRRRRLALLLAACMAAFVSGGVTLAATSGPSAGRRLGASTDLPPPRSGFAPAAGYLDLGDSRRARCGRHPQDSGAAARRTRAHGVRRQPGVAVPRRGPRPATACRRDADPPRGVDTGTDPGGRPIAAVWSPFPIRIAYVLRTPAGFTVGDLWGTGTHPFTVDRDAAPVMPAWRWDSKALAYVTASGAVVVHDVIGGANRPIATACRIRRPAAIAFAPAGGALAIADRAGRLALVDTTGTGRPRCLAGPKGRPFLAWLGRDQLLAAAGAS